MFDDGWKDTSIGVGSGNASQDVSGGGWMMPGGYNGTPNVPQTSYPPQNAYPPTASSLPYPPQPFPGSESGGGFSAIPKPANALNGQIAERLEMQNPATGNAGGSLI